MKLALGTVQFGLDYGVTNNIGKVPISEVIKILELARQNKINVVDTAPGYGNSESVLGAVGVNDFKTVTKTISINNGIDAVVNTFRQSLIKLNQCKVYGLLIHDMNDLQHSQFDDLFKQLNELKHQGLIDKIGFSIYTPGQVNFLLDNFDFDLIQVPFNVFDRRLIEGGQLKALKSIGVEVYARSVFLQGLLLNAEKARSYKFKRWNTLWRIWFEWLNDNQITALEASIKYAVSIPDISKILVGVDNEDQLKEIVAASFGKLPKIPTELYTEDISLLNPSNWGNL